MMPEPEASAQLEDDAVRELPRERTGVRSVPDDQEKETAATDAAVQTRSSAYPAFGKTKAYLRSGPCPGCLHATTAT